MRPAVYWRTDRAIKKDGDLAGVQRLGVEVAERPTRVNVEAYTHYLATRFPGREDFGEFQFPGSYTVDRFAGRITDDRERASYLLEASRLFETAGMFDDAVHCLYGSADASPSMRAYLKLVQLHIVANRFNDIVPFIKAVADGYPEVYLLLVTYSYNPDQTESFYREWIELEAAEPGEILARYGQWLLNERGDLDGAAAALEEASDLLVSFGLLADIDVVLYTNSTEAGSEPRGSRRLPADPNETGASKFQDIDDYVRDASDTARILANPRVPWFTERTDPKFGQVAGSIYDYDFRIHSHVLALLEEVQRLRSESSRSTLLQQDAYARARERRLEEAAASKLRTEVEGLVKEGNLSAAEAAIAASIDAGNPFALECRGDLLISQPGREVEAARSFESGAQQGRIRLWLKAEEAWARTGDGTGALLARRQYEIEHEKRESAAVPDLGPRPCVSTRAKPQAGLGDVSLTVLLEARWHYLARDSLDLLRQSLQPEAGVRPVTVRTLTQHSMEELFRLCPQFGPDHRQHLRETLAAVGLHMRGEPLMLVRARTGVAETTAPATRTTRDFAPPGAVAPANKVPPQFEVEQAPDVTASRDEPAQKDAAPQGTRDAQRHRPRNAGAHGKPVRQLTQDDVPLGVNYAPPGAIASGSAKSGTGMPRATSPGAGEPDDVTDAPQPRQLSAAPRRAGEDTTASGPRSGTSYAPHTVTGAHNHADTAAIPPPAAQPVDATTPARLQIPGGTPDGQSVTEPSSSPGASRVADTAVVAETQNPGVERSTRAQPGGRDSPPAFNR